MSKKNSSVILKNNFKGFKDLTEIYNSFKKKINPFKKKNFLVAVSGGPDSLALAALTKSLNYEKNLKFFYVLIDHNIRANSSKEAISVKKLLDKNKIKLKIIKNKKEIKKNVQSQARTVRYNLLADFCKEKKISIILTAHNLEDQVETFFIRLSRGSGLYGLSSMKQISEISKKIHLVRPLLDVKKEKLIKISKTVFGKYFKDPTNVNSKYLRTRIRSLKKSLEKSGINYDRIFQSIKNLATSRDTLDLYFKAIYKRIILKKRNKVFIKFNDLNILNQEMKMRVFEKLIKDLTNSYYMPRSKKVINLVNTIESKKRTKLTLGGCIIYRDNNQIILEKEIKI